MVPTMKTNIRYPIVLTESRDEDKKCEEWGTNRKSINQKISSSDGFGIGELTKLELLMDTF